MQPEGPNNSPLVSLKTLIPFSLIGTVGVSAVSRVYSLSLGVPHQWLLIRMSGCLALLYITASVFAGHRGRLMSAEVEFDDKDRFVSQVTDALTKQQFQPAFREGTTLTFKPQFLFGMYDSVTINLGDGGARVVGPRFCVKCVMDTAAVGAEQLKTQNL